MAIFPVLGQSYSSSRKALPDVKVDVADDGTAHAQSFYSKTQYELNIIFPLLSNTEQSSIQDFYNTNKALEFVFNRAADGLDYTVIFLAEPDFNKVNHNNWVVTLKARGVLL